MGDGLGGRQREVWGNVHETIKRLSLSHLPEDNATREHELMLVRGVARVLLLQMSSRHGKKTSAEDTRQGVWAPSISILAPLEGVGGGVEGAITFFFLFPNTRPFRPQSPFTYDPGKGIIREWDGDQRPGEMNSGAPKRHSGGMKRWIGAD